MTTEPWQTTFLNAGTKEVGKDLSVLILTVRDIIDSQLSLQASTLLEKLEGEKGNGKVISGSPGPMYDWGCTQGFDMALDRAKELVRELL